MSLVYVVEDDEDINELLVFNLRKEGFDVKSFLSSIPALQSLEKEKPDIILLDIMLPDMDGLEFCKKLKSDERFSEIPIIMLTAKSTEIDKIVGLELGADDYITKPFSLREVIARIRAILRRTGCKDKEKRSFIKIKGIEISPEKFEVKVDGKEIPLTSKEFKLLMLLINNKGKVLSREQILSQIWKDEFDVYDRTIDVHIKKLRDKLGKYGKYIKTVRGVGYMWEEEDYSSSDKGNLSGKGK
ncbi:response regulator transcription factor [Persephonella sp.]|uniref:response regulator transcription factor n=1 Tax=Persephonella sp. TaxID=2060922 RepID=UPI0026137BF3|nr:response regulator transcription factor [Persephonella sp.]